MKECLHISQRSDEQNKQDRMVDEKIGAVCLLMLEPPLLAGCWAWSEPRHDPHSLFTAFSARDTAAPEIEPRRCSKDGYMDSGRSFHWCAERREGQQQVTGNDTKDFLSCIGYTHRSNR